jgi:hypothetical protein
MEVTTFTCSICGDASHKICVYCTNDACNNHLCHRCLRCSECCHCDMPTTEDEEPEPAVTEPSHELVEAT